MEQLDFRHEVRIGSDCFCLKGLRSGCQAFIYANAAGWTIGWQTPVLKCAAFHPFANLEEAFGYLIRFFHQYRSNP